MASKANHLEMPVGIRSARYDDIRAIAALETSLREDRPEASQQGFLLSAGDSFETYQEFIDYGAFLVAELKDQLVAFWFALPPESERMNKLKSAKESFKLTKGNEGIFELPNLAWLAKVAVSPSFMRQGVATQLYQEGFKRFSNWNVLTTTVREPLFNTPSFELQKKFGFQLVGTLPLGDRGALRNVVCDVHFRALELIKRS